MSSISEFISALHLSHLDNGRMVYYAAKAGADKAKPVMPATPFIFEYFIYNSIYQHDWLESDTLKHLVAHGEANRKSGSEEEQQDRLRDEYLLPLCRSKPQMLMDAFSPFQYLIDLNGKWTDIKPDAKLTAQQGRDFFEAVRNIKSIVTSDLSPGSIDELFKQLKTCSNFVRMVRNNIFHGRKKLDEIWEDNQRKRLELYHLFIQSLNSLFFLTRPGIDKVASEEVFSPMEIRASDTPLIVTSMKVLELFVEGLIKREDPELVAWASGQLEPLKGQRESSGAMFYPSAGRDIITPLLIGLPFCTDFHFYNKDDIPSHKLRSAFTHLGKVLGQSCGLSINVDKKRNFLVEYEYAGTKRRIFHMKEENQDFLKSASRLMFFFHRGDGEGEGGSDQPWDGEWFARWKEMIPAGRLCAVLTDGIPYGLHPELARRLTKHPTLLSTPHRGPYSCGIIQF